MPPRPAIKRGRFVEWAGRHRRATAVLAALLLLLVAGIAVTAIVGVRRSDAEARFQRAKAARNEAEVLFAANQPALAERACRQAIAGLQELNARSPSERRYRRELSAAQEIMGHIEVANHQPERAEAAYLQAIRLSSKLLAEDPSDLELQLRTAACSNRVAALQHGRGRWQDARGSLESGCVIDNYRRAGQLRDPRIGRELVSLFNQRCLLDLELGSWPQAVANCESAIRVQKELVKTSADRGESREILSYLLINKARVHSAAIQPAEAERALVAALELAENLRSEFPSTARYQDLAASTLGELAGTIGAESRRGSEVRGLLERALAIRGKLATPSPASPDDLAKLAEACGSLADAYRDEKSYEKAEALLRKELVYQSELRAKHPDVVAYRFRHARALHNLADLLQERGRPAEALELERAAVGQLLGVYRENVLDPEMRTAASYACWGLCRLELGRNDHRAAAKAVKDYLDIEPRGFEEAHESAGFLCRCVQLCRADPTVAAAERDALAWSYAKQAVGALQRALQLGFVDARELKTSHTYDPLRGRDDFQRLLREIEARAEALREARSAPGVLTPAPARAAQAPPTP
jgi:tetratricopeptide (TPR) repeat protein